MAAKKSKLKKRVLIVDDDDHLRNLHGSMLAEEGFAVSVATTGLEAFALCQHYTFDLVIAELHLHGKDDLWFIENLRQQTAASKFIGTAKIGSLQPDYCVRMARHLDAQRVLTKPFPPEQLLTVARDVLKKN
jgi:two-component system OmpR family response regulator